MLNAKVLRLPAPRLGKGRRTTHRGRYRLVHHVGEALGCLCDRWLWQRGRFLQEQTVGYSVEATWWPPKSLQLSPIYLTF